MYNLQRRITCSLVGKKDIVPHLWQTDAGFLVAQKLVTAPGNTHKNSRPRIQEKEWMKIAITILECDVGKV